MRTDTPDDADHAKRIIAAMSDDERQRMSALMQRRNDALRGAAAATATATAIKDRVVSELSTLRAARLAGHDAAVARSNGEQPPKRTRKPSVSSVIKQAAKAGLAVARVEVDPTSGKIVVVTGKPGETTPDDNSNSDEWDGVILQ